uniref:Uncharacterized protein n=1 Tax=Knipowitschia caucasica TaxID=637954 RepID=A0AAV2KQ60_KNICA
MACHTTCFMRNHFIMTVSSTTEPRPALRLLTTNRVAATVRLHTHMWARSLARSLFHWYKCVLLKGCTLGQFEEASRFPFHLQPLFC